MSLHAPDCALEIVAVYSSTNICITEFLLRVSGSLAVSAGSGCSDVDQLRILCNLHRVTVTSLVPSLDSFGTTPLREVSSDSLLTFDQSDT